MFKLAQIKENDPFQHHLSFHVLDRQILPQASGVELGESDVDLWKVSLDMPRNQIDELYYTLSGVEQRKADYFRFAEQRSSYIISYGILRKVLGAYLKMNPVELNFNYGKNGKPVLAGVPSDEMIHFNMSSSRNLTVIAISRYYEIGIDIEYIGDIPEIDRTANQFFSKAEADVFHALPVYEKTKAFYNCWTRKQAFLKAIGNGSLYPLKTFDVTLAPHEPAQLLRVKGKPQEASRWSIQAIMPETNYTGAIAVRNFNFQLKIYEDWYREHSEAYQLAA